MIYTVSVRPFIGEKSQSGGDAMKFDEKSLSALSWGVPDYHQRQAAHLRSLAANATTVKVKARLLDEARKHEDIARGDAEPASASEA